VFPYTSGDKLIILTAEVDNQYKLMI